MNIERYASEKPTSSKAIPIPKKQSSFCDDNDISFQQYDLKKNCFDPTKGSSPNSWRSRLMERIENYSTSATKKSFNLIIE